MSSPTHMSVTRSEDFFRLCNTHHTRAPYLRSQSRIIEAMGVLGISEGKVREIMDKVETILLRDGAPNLRTKEGWDQRTTTTAAVSTQYPEVFDMACNGAEEEKFVREKAIEAMIRYAARKAQKTAHATRRRIAKGAKQGATDDSDGEMELGDDGHQSTKNNEVGALSSVATSDEEAQAMAKTTEDIRKSSPSPSALTSREESPTSTPTKAKGKAKASTSTALPSVSIEIWSTQHARSLLNVELKDVLLPGGRRPSYDTLNDEVRRILPAIANPPYILPGRLQFVHVLYDGTNTGIISQEVLTMEWDDWRRGSSNAKSFRLWVRDCPTEAAHERSQPPIKYGAWGWEYHPLLNGPIRFGRLPLRFCRPPVSVGDL